MKKLVLLFCLIFPAITGCTYVNKLDNDIVLHPVGQFVTPDGLRNGQQLYVGKIHGKLYYITTSHNKSYFYVGPEAPSELMENKNQ